MAVCQICNKDIGAEVSCLECGKILNEIDAYVYITNASTPPKKCGDSTIILTTKYLIINCETENVNTLGVAVGAAIGATVGGALGTYIGDNLRKKMQYKRYRVCYETARILGLEQDANGFIRITIADVGVIFFKTDKKSSESFMRNIYYAKERTSGQSVATINKNNCPFCKSPNQLKRFCTACGAKLKQ